ncbi:hypothetical protein Mgra_00000994 [Meloidogyne graminicola]|uniref:RRM domain-containing protein n=1 Tax=Meloidogyne graminicola TaxID=189291 RepID=A0A8T0A2Q7_9BILA|nr:hypothetical protein Mgra_00000994 [Meloidogyne graminicola]
MASFPISSQRKFAGNRFQIKGFPKIWIEKLTFDDIAWYLFDLLNKYGPIENIAVSSSKKDSTVYGIVDMKGGKSIVQIKKELLDEHGQINLSNWDATLSFKQIDADNKPKRTDDLTKKVPLKDLMLQFTPPESNESFHSSTMDKQSDFSGALIEKNSSEFVYSREFILGLRDTISPSRYQTDPQFREILRSVENIDYGSSSGNTQNNGRYNKYNNRRQNENRGYSNVFLFKLKILKLFIF